MKAEPHPRGPRTAAPPARTRHDPSGSKKKTKKKNITALSGHRVEPAASGGRLDNRRERGARTKTGFLPAAQFDKQRNVPVGSVPVACKKISINPKRTPKRGFLGGPTGEAWKPRNTPFRIGDGNLRDRGGPRRGETL
jgi:hypothetical protein